MFADRTTITRCRDNWARTISPNPNVKIYVGAPASSTAAGGGYQAIGTMSTIATTMRKSFPSFGGVMMWDASQAYGEHRVAWSRLFMWVSESLMTRISKRPL